MTGIHPFRIDVPDEALDRIRARVAEYPWRCILPRWTGAQRVIQSLGEHADVVRAE